MRKLVFRLKPGELSGIVDTEYGYHIVQVEEKQDAHTQTFEEARPQLLLEAKKQVAAEMLRRIWMPRTRKYCRTPSQAAAIAAKYGLKYIKQENVANSAQLPELQGDSELANAIQTTAKGASDGVYTRRQRWQIGFAVIVNVTLARKAELDEVRLK